MSAKLRHDWLMDHARSLTRRRLLIGASAFFSPAAAFASDYGTIRSKFTTIFRRRCEGPLLSEWRSSEYRDFTIIGMNAAGSGNNLRVEFSLVHTRMVSCDLMIEGSKSEARQFALWLAVADAKFDPGSIAFGAESSNTQRVALERTLTPGSYKVEGLWRGRRNTEYLPPRGRAELVVTIHSVVA